MRVLIIEDCGDLREVLCELLRLDGFEVVEAGTAARALEAVRTMRFAAALIDHNLPDARGDALAEHLRALQPHLHLVAMTGEATLRTAPAFDTLLRKPFEPSELTQVLRRLENTNLASAP